MSKKKWIFLAILMCFVLIGSAEAQHKYVGAKKCSMCHKSEKRGNQYQKWLDSRHAKAFETLGGEKAAKIAKEKGIEGSPQEAPQCYKCHVTAFDVDESLIMPAFKKEDGVQCEVCHGPGSDYAKLAIMKEKEQAVAAGLIIPTEELCRKCHNEEAPTFAGFNYEEYFKKIAHPLPKK